MSLALRVMPRVVSVIGSAWFVPATVSVAGLGSSARLRAIVEIGPGGRQEYRWEQT